MKDKLLTTKEAAERLGITAGRVRQMVLAGQLESAKPGRDLVIRESALASVADRRPGRPPKAEAKDSPAKNGRNRAAKKKGAK
ncbi:MAG: helix-turn-helix domain-containing protein [Blastocatellia bacterium]